MPRPERVLARHAARSVRVPTLVLCVLAVVMIATAASSAGLVGDMTRLTSAPAIRALYGEPFDLTSAGGLFAWRYGAVLAVFVAVWALLATTRLLRGEEEAGRSELVLAAPLRQARAALSGLGVVCAACLIVGVVVAGTLMGVGEAAAGSLLEGAALASIGIVFAAVGAVTSQLFAQRRRAAGVAGLAAGVGFLVRMVADGSNGMEWLRWLSPFGWVEEVRPFGGDWWATLIVPVVAAGVLAVIALVLTGHRDLGSGFVGVGDTAPARTRLLGNPLAFTWRQRLGGALAWGAALVLAGVVLGSVTSSLMDFMASNEAMQELSARFGFGTLATVGTFVAVLDAMVPVAVSLYVVASVHLLWEDEESGRLQLVHVGGVTRTRWLAATVAVTVAVAVLLTLAFGTATWAVTALQHVGLSLGQALAGVANTLPVTAVFVGIVVLLHGVRPGLASAVGGGAVGLAYVLSFVGPALRLPGWVNSLTPFRHIAAVPAAPVGWAAVLAMVAVGFACTAAGFAAYSRRDLH